MSEGSCVENRDEEDKNRKQELKEMEDEVRIRRYKEMKLMTATWQILILELLLC